MFRRYVLTFNAKKKRSKQLTKSRIHPCQNQQHYTIKLLKVSELALIRSSSIWDDGNSIGY